MIERRAPSPSTVRDAALASSRPRLASPLRSALLGSLALMGSLGAASAVAAQTAGVPAQSQAAQAEASARIAAQGALTDALRRIAASPTNAQALLDAGRAAITLRDPRAAQGFLGRAAQLDPANGAIKAALGSALLQTEDAAGALRQFEAARQAGVPERVYLADRALAYDLLGNGAAAQRDYALAQSLAPTPELTRRQALSLGIAGEADRAVELLGPLLRDQDRAAWRTRAFILAINSRHDEARDIAYATMPRAMADGVLPYLKSMDRLTPAQQAAAAHFGNFPTGPLGPVRTARAQVPTPVATNAAIASARTQPTDRLRRGGRRTMPSETTAASGTQGRDRLGGGAVASRPDREARALAGRTSLPTPVASPAPTTAAPSVTAPIRTASAAPAPGIAQLPTPSIAQPGGGFAPLPPLVRPAGSDATPLPRLIPTPAPSPAPAPVSAMSVAAQPTAVGAPPPGTVSILAPVPAPVASSSAPDPAAATSGSVPASALVPRPEPVTAPSAPAIQPVALPPSTPQPAPVVVAATVPTPAPATSSAPVTPAPSGFSLADIASSIAIPSSELATAPGALDPVALERVAAEAREAERRRAAEARAKARADEQAAAAVKAKADAAAEAKAKADAEAKAAAELKKAAPARSWVQIATGASTSALATDFRRFARQYTEALKGKSAATAAWGRTRRLVVGPFENARAAQGWLATYKKAGGDGFVWTSGAGEEVTPLGGR